jgi:hypothetical protein
MSPQFDLLVVLMNACRDLAMEIGRLDHVSARHGRSIWPASRTGLVSAGPATIGSDLLYCDDSDYISTGSTCSDEWSVELGRLSACLNAFPGSRGVRSTEILCLSKLCAFAGNLKAIILTTPNPHR